MQESIVSLALATYSKMRFKVTSEGVEPPEQEEALAAIGCHMCQVWHFSLYIRST